MMKADAMKTLHFRKIERSPSDEVEFLPEPDRRPRPYLIISVDDHLIEPPETFDGRMAAKWADRAPKLIHQDDGTDAWLFEGKLHPNIGMNAVAGRPVADCTFEPQRFSHMRTGAYDVHARVHDMDLDGVYASLCFPSGLVGFGGQRLQQETSDPELALALVRAINDWHLESWVGAYPERFIPIQIPYLLDVEIAAEEIRRNAARGFRAVTFPEAVHKLGFPSLHTGHWDPFVAACAETETVICLHIGSAGEVPSTAPDAPTDTVGVLFFGTSMFAAIDWLYSMYPVKHPNLKIAMSEGGIAWVPGLMDRLDHTRRYHEIYGTWVDLDITPVEVLQRNFFHCVLDDPSNMRLRDRIGVEHIMVEADYPHLDSSWPDTQAMFAKQLVGASDYDVRRITWENAAQLFRHPVPQSVIDDPESYRATAR